MSTMTDDEQKEKMKSLLKRYGSPIVTGVLLALCAFFAWQWWNKNQEVTSSNLTVQYQNVLNQLSAAENDEASYKKLLAEANQIIAENADSAQVVQSQLLVAKLAFDKKDYAIAEKLLKQAQASKLKDEGLKSIAALHLAYVQINQDQLDAALKTLDGIKLEQFTPSVAEARGDIFVAKKDQASAKKAYQQAWDVLVERKQPRELLQIKLANLGVLVEDLEIESPVLTPAQAPVGDSSEP